MPSNLIGRKFGPLNHARWLSLGQRILALYIKTKRPSKSLIKLAEFTIRGYGCIWFISRMKPSVVDAPRNLFKWAKSIYDNDRGDSNDKKDDNKGGNKKESSKVFARWEMKAVL